jgi:hypothetical protein
MFSIDFESLEELIEAMEVAEDPDASYNQEPKEFDLEFRSIIGEELYSLEVSIYGKG